MRLDVMDLSVRIGHKDILEKVDFRLGEHRFIGILGPNGSGKSTLLKTFYKVIRPHQGCILVNGQSLSEISQKKCALTFSVLPQHQGLEVDLTVEDVIHMGLYPGKTLFAGSTTDEWNLVFSTLTQLGIEHLSGRKINTLSGGERQMVMLARAIVQNTPCLLLDEPTNHLDIYHQIIMLDSMAGLAKQIIVVFHDLSLAGKYCDYIYMMKDGHIFEKGRPTEVLTGDKIRAVYGIEVEVVRHPRTFHPVVLL